MNIPETKTQFIRVADLRPNEGQIPEVPANPRYITEDEYRALVESLRADNLTGVLQVKVYQHDGQWIVLDGNMRLRALQELRIEKVQCVIVPEGTDAPTLRKIVLNSNSNFGQWDWDLLSGWPEDELEAANIEWPDMGDEHPTNTKAADVQEDDFDEEKDEVKSRCASGDLWRLGDHLLLCGDSTKPEDVQRLMQGELADLWITDPPYNVDYEGHAKFLKNSGRPIASSGKIMNDFMDEDKFFDFLFDAFTAAKQNMRPGAAFYIWHSDAHGLTSRQATHQVGLKVRQCLIWNKSSITIGRSDYQWKHEPASTDGRTARATGGSTTGARRPSWTLRNRARTTCTRR